MGILVVITVSILVVVDQLLEVHFINIRFSKGCLNKLSKSNISKIWDESTHIISHFCV